MAASIDPGAPVPADAIDPDLIKLKRKKLQIGLITAAGLVFLAIFYVWRLLPDRRFSGEGAKPVDTQVADIVDGKVALDSFVRVPAEPLVGHAIRTRAAKGKIGYRVVPTRGSSDRLWLVVSGDGWDPASPEGYVGRLRKLSDLPLSESVSAFAAEHPRPVFATPAAIRAAFTTGTVATVAGDTATIAPGDKVAFDSTDPKASKITGSFTQRVPDEAAWTKALADANIATTGPGIVDQKMGQIVFTAPIAVADAQTALLAAKLYGATVDPVVRHYETTWAKLSSSKPGALDGGTAAIADDQIDLVGVYIARGVPAGAYALIVGEQPAEYWYVTWILGVLVGIGALFAWALVRAVRREIKPSLPAARASS
ncbi:MAG TPA: hypothetical protein VGM88_01130 [Kofleriaceae bacterium]